MAKRPITPTNPRKARPFHRTALPFHGTTPPNRGMLPPFHGTTRPFHGTAPPFHGTAPPFHETTPPNRGTAPPNLKLGVRECCSHCRVQKPRRARTGSRAGTRGSQLFYHPWISF